MPVILFAAAAETDQQQQAGYLAFESGFINTLPQSNACKAKECLFDRLYRLITRQGCSKKGAWWYTSSCCHGPSVIPFTAIAADPLKTSAQSIAGTMLETTEPYCTS